MNKFLALVFLVFSQGCFVITLESPDSYGRQAETHIAKKEYVEAIADYRLHIADRLKERAEDENPYFYYLLIGDCYLEMDNLVESEKSYLSAQDNKVDAGLVAERFRRIAKVYQEKQEFEEALDFLKKYRDLDPLLFDIEIDRVHKIFVSLEIQKEREKANKISD